MVIVLTSSAANRGFEPRSGQTKDNKTAICYSSAKPVEFMSKSNDWFARKAVESGFEPLH